MKKIILFAFAFVGLSFASCSNGQTTNNDENDSVVIDSIDPLDTTDVDTVYC